MEGWAPSVRPHMYRGSGALSCQCIHPCWAGTVTEHRRTHDFVSAVRESEFKFIVEYAAAAGHHAKP